MADSITEQSPQNLNMFGILSYYLEISAKVSVNILDLLQRFLNNGIFGEYQNNLVIFALSNNFQNLSAYIWNMVHSNFKVYILGQITNVNRLILG